MSIIELYDPNWNGEVIIPKRVVIETVFGCNATCGMCVINHPTPRKKGAMPMEQYERLLNHLVPYRSNIEKFDLFGLGEPLADRYITERIAMAKRLGFQNTAISTNGHLLTVEKQQGLLEAGIDTIIFSIDGATKQTHEAIRTRTNFDRIVENTANIIRLRDEGGFKTRFVIRFIRQEANAREWDAYKEFWSRLVSPERRDIIVAYDVHNWSGQVDAVPNPGESPPVEDPIRRLPCHHIFEKMVILADGSVALCFEDILEAQFKFGNAFEQDPIKVFNSPRFNKIRKLHLAGKRCNLKVCSGCMVLNNETLKTTG